jgi:hypothetical protein
MARRLRYDFIVVIAILGIAYGYCKVADDDVPVGNDDDSGITVDDDDSAPGDDDSSAADDDDSAAG